MTPRVKVIRVRGGDPSYHLAFVYLDLHWNRTGQSHVLLTFVWRIKAFPSGAPVEACDSLLPRHIHTTPKNSSESPFFFTASASRYFPDSKRRKIKVRIGGAPFRGFFVVALDGETHERVGHFLEARGLEPVPCAAATHTDGRSKVGATLLWQPPEDSKSGRVIFLATVLENFSSYYSGLLASVPVKKRKKNKNKLKELHSYQNTTLAPQDKS